MLVGMLLASSDLVQAAPVTLAFEATINTVIPGIPFDSGLDYRVGDVVKGRFTFDPQIGTDNMYLLAPQPHELVLDIHGAVFATPGFQIESVNDSSISDFDLASVVDILNVGAGGLSPANSATFPNLDPHQSSFRLTLYGPQTIYGPAIALQIASLPANVADWNTFTIWRQLSVAFGDGKGGAIGFQATVGPFTAVPEPASGELASLLVAFGLLKHRQIEHNN
jgi:hypothetical protein